MKYILILAVFLTSFSCGKKNPYTKKTTGKYLYCKIDGVDYYPEQDPVFNAGKALIGKIENDDSLFTISSYNMNDKRLAIGIWDYTKIKASQYYFGAKLPYQNSAWYDDTPLGSGQFDTDSNNNGNCLITKIDYNQKLIEGTFSFKCYNQLTNKTANITDGEFSLFFNQ